MIVMLAVSMGLYIPTGPIPVLVLSNYKDIKSDISTLM